ncbi:hypothetical protein MHO82_04240 [Vibrio sp. Of7-15]|uniref:hypothetical protein n=1 Tax=Vibrio sp. Of7-15 TaxID=2724879 RepID=UPI001EF31B66|nr:hypothetical protein [Vibrio sp. Of7-15]MCG7496058.1 hypothetical protein [Vibrio sp. Of7-15]
MRLGRLSLHRWRTKQKTRQSRFWGMTSLGNRRKKISKTRALTAKRNRRVEYVVLAACRNEEDFDGITQVVIDKKTD